MYGQEILCGISKGTFEIPHKISHPYMYIERCGFYSLVQIKELLDLRAHKCFWNAKRSPGGRNPSPWKIRTYLFYCQYHGIDERVMQEAVQMLIS